MSEKLEPDPPMKAFVKGPLDGYMGIVVLVNLIFMILETQWTAANADSMLNVGPPPEWGIGETFFQVAEYVFFSTYAIDVLVRIIILRSEWYYDKREGIMFLNVFDACVVAVNAVELLLLPLLVLGSDPDQVNSIRVIKLFRIARTLRIVKTGVVMDPGTEESTRIEVNRLYGSFLKALYTMFEITHSGSWPAVVRPIVEQVDAWYAVLFLAYITLVVFAVIRIVTALFLKETLASAANDADMVMEDNRRSAVEANMKLQELFHAADDDGDGHLSPDEFVQALTLPSVQGFLQSMEVNIRDTGPLFEILDDGDGRITIAEFCKGLMQLKGQARALDIIVLQHELAKLFRECKEIHQDLRRTLTPLSSPKRTS
ncbi:unnamed protein product [Durusdinium trenchii]|uniref:EF-hand domain-containing protein n=1 Tax=Durusdinium trenchii TaxID=1381693 RepID=A0ABP0M418_9DINO